ncbi:MAG TPA: hypothetical protein VM388_10900 [Acidimicrobiales bacterium]|nr:hypothetical protein [Acidimicrobiales bacterium]
MSEPEFTVEDDDAFPEEAETKEPAEPADDPVFLALREGKVVSLPRPEAERERSRLIYKYRRMAWADGRQLERSDDKEKGLIRLRLKPEGT